MSLSLNFFRQVLALNVEHRYIGWEVHWVEIYRNIAQKVWGSWSLNIIWDDTVSNSLAWGYLINCNNYSGRIISPRWMSLSLDKFWNWTLNIDMTIYQLTGSFDVYRKALLATTKKTEGFEFVVTAPKCFCIYRLKCSKAQVGMGWVCKSLTL